MSIGYIVYRSTLPTGKAYFLRLTATPSRLPAAMTWYSGASSQKYFREVTARSQSWISSKTMSVFPLVIV